MNRRTQSFLVFIAATMIAAVSSHGVISCLKMGSTPKHFVIGKSVGNPPAFMGASSIGFYGIDWDQIASDAGTQIWSWAVPGATPLELEQFQKRAPEARTTFIVVSTVDLDEASSCEFRASIVPVDQAINSLWLEHAGWQEAKRVLGLYPVAWLQVLFPTLGRAHAVMGTALMRAGNLIRHSSGKPETVDGPTLKVGKLAHDEYAMQRLSDWPRAKVLSKLESMRVEFRGVHSFNGAKRQALERMLQYANQRGPSVVLVMPVSSSYNQEYVPPDLARQFETSLAELQRGAPQTQFLRLDQVPGASSDQNFCDLVHMNAPGQKLATDALEAWVKNSRMAHQP
jgi:hypothetical protein